MSEMSYLNPIAKLIKTDNFSLKRNCEHVSEIKKLQRRVGFSLRAGPEDAGRCGSSMGRRAGIQKFHTASRDIHIYILSSGDKLGFATDGTLLE